MTIKTLIFKLILVMLPVTLLFLYFESLAQKVPTSYNIKNANVLANPEKIEVLVLGSSHANFGINPEYMGRTVQNLANTSQDLYYDYSLLSKYLRNCKNLKVVVLPISYFSLYYCLYDSPEKWRTDFYAATLDIPKPSASNSDDIDLREHSHLALMEGPCKVFGELRNKNRIEINNYGYQKPRSQGDCTERINYTAGKRRVDFHHTIMHRKYLYANIQNIEKIATLLKSRGIKLYFITTPVFWTYYNNISPDYYKEMTSSLALLEKKYNARYLNYMCDSRFQMQDFMDNDHLNEKGAKKFSLILKKDICYENSGDTL